MLNLDQAATALRDVGFTLLVIIIAVVLLEVFL